MEIEGRSPPQLPGACTSLAQADRSSTAAGACQPRAGREQTSPGVAGRRCQSPQGPREGLHRALSCADPNPGLTLPHGLSTPVHWPAQPGHASSMKMLYQKAQAQIFESSSVRAVYCASVTNKLLNVVYHQA